MNRTLRVVSLAVLLVAAVGGVLAVGALDRPTIAATESRLVGVNESTSLVETDVVLSNPNPVGVRLGGATVRHTVSMNGIGMGTGSEEGLNVTEGNTTVGLTTAIDNRKVPEWWASHVENGERTRLDATASLDLPLLGPTVELTRTHTTRTDITGAFNSSDPRPVNANLPLVEDPILVVNRTAATWGDVTSEETPLVAELAVYNPKDVPLAITRIDYTVTMNGVAVGNGTTDRGYTIPAEGRRSIRAETVVRNHHLDEWWVTHVRRNQHTDLRVAFTAVLELPSGETVELPLDGLGYETTIETDVLGTKPPRTGGRRSP